MSGNQSHVNGASGGDGGRYSFYSSQSMAKSFTDLAQGRDKFSGSTTNLSAFGSTQDLSLDPMRRMSMQEDARSHRISAEVMKQRLYESVITSPRRRRQSMKAMSMSGEEHDDEIQMFARAARMAQSLPVTPAVTPGASQNTSPLHSPTAHKKFSYQQYNNQYSTAGAPPHHHRADRYAFGDSWASRHYGNPRGYGLATLFKPRSRCATIQQRVALGEEAGAAAAARNDQPMDGVETNMTFSSPSSQQLYQRYQMRSQLNPAGAAGMSTTVGVTTSDATSDGVFLAPVGTAPRRSPNASPHNHPNLHLHHPPHHTADHLHPSNHPNSQGAAMHNDIEMETDEPPGL